MGRLTPNQALAGEVIGRLLAGGVRTFCVCPGGRNAPLVEALEAAAGGGIELLDFFEERSAGFFALGRARRDRLPVAVVTTSGTAAAELLPAIVEAYYSGAPLVAVTADRPRSYRGTGAPQAIEQQRLYGVYAPHAVDLDEAGGAWALDPDRMPSHVNVAFDEPLLAGWQAGVTDVGEPQADIPTPPRTQEGEAVTAAKPGPLPLAAALDGCSRPLVLLGALHRADDQRDALAYCRRLGAPVLAEASSHVKPLLGDLLLTAGEAVAKRGLEGRSFDAVIRLGDIPSWRLWRDLETCRVPVVSVSRLPWRGLTHGLHAQVPAGDALSGSLPDIAPFDPSAREAITAVDRRVHGATSEVLSRFGRSEPALVRAVSRTVPARSFVYLGNSQPIREWNQFADADDSSLLFGENRGANGIDGQISSFLGAARDDRENWAIVGDLTALYDLPSPWAMRHVRGPVRLVVINNGGGRIFERLFANPRFQNRHALGFEAFAALWGLDYRRDLAIDSARPAVIELQPDADETRAFWTAWQEVARG